MLNLLIHKLQIHDSNFRFKYGPLDTLYGVQFKFLNVKLLLIIERKLLKKKKNSRPIINADLRNKRSCNF